MRRWAGPPIALVLALVAGCDSHSAPSESAPAPEPVVKTSPYHPTPILGSIKPGEVDFPMPHMRFVSGWGSMQRGVNMWVVSGLGWGLYDAKGNPLYVGEVCSIAAHHEEQARVRDLVHCYWDKVSRGTYEVQGMSGTVARLRRSDGARFTYDMKSGRLSAVAT